MKKTVTPKPLTQQLSDLENEAFEVEVDYRVDNLYTTAEFNHLMNMFNNRINILMRKIYPPEYLEEPEECPCNRIHVKESFFLHSYYYNDQPTGKEQTGLTGQEAFNRLTERTR